MVLAINLTLKRLFIRLFKSSRLSLVIFSSEECILQNKLNLFLGQFRQVISEIKNFKTSVYGYVQDLMSVWGTLFIP